MLVGTQQTLAKVTTFCVAARDQILERVYKFKYVVVMLDPSLVWNDHVDAITTKMSSRLACCARSVRLSLERLVSLYTTERYFPFLTIVSLSGNNRDYLEKLQSRAAGPCGQYHRASLSTAGWNKPNTLLAIIGITSIVSSLSSDIQVPYFTTRVIFFVSLNRW